MHIRVCNYCCSLFVNYSLQQTEEVHDILRADFVPVGRESVCGQRESQTMHVFTTNVNQGVVKLNKQRLLILELNQLEVFDVRRLADTATP